MKIGCTCANEVVCRWCLASLGSLDLNVWVRRIADYGALTERQTAVLAGMLCGLSNAEIADHLDTSVRNVKCHASAVLEKLEIGNRAQLLRFFWDI